ncbi:hypothetical protein ACHAQJ_003415 [Trichoderma viride]
MKASVVFAVVSTMMASTSALVPPTRTYFNGTHPYLPLNASVAARKDSGVPTCAVPCLQSAISKTTNCNVTDFACACKYQSKINGAATSCVVGSCGLQNAIKKVVPAVRKLCKEETKKEGKEKGKGKKGKKEKREVEVVEVEDEDEEDEYEDEFDEYEDEDEDEEN